MPEPTKQMVYRILRFAHEIDHVVQAIKYNTRDTSVMDLDELKDSMKRMRNAATRAEIIVNAFKKDIQQYYEILE